METEIYIKKLHDGYFCRIWEHKYVATIDLPGPKSKRKTNHFFKQQLSQLWRSMYIPNTVLKKLAARRKLSREPLIEKHRHIDLLHIFIFKYFI